MKMRKKLTLPKRKLNHKSLLSHKWKSIIMRSSTKKRDLKYHEKEFRRFRDQIQCLKTPADSPAHKKEEDM